MNLEKWALISEIVGGVAIVLSLVFVGLQIRSSTQVDRAVSYERNIDSINQWRLGLLSDPEALTAWGEFAGTLPENPTPEDVKSVRLFITLNALFGIYEKSWFATHYGVMAEEEWERFARQACQQRSKARERGLWEQMEPLLTRAFTDYLSSECPTG